MAFFDTGGPDGLLPVADIERMERGWVSGSSGEHHSAVVTMESGRTIEVEDAVIDQILKVQSQLIPVAEGHTLVTFCYFPGTSDPGPWMEQRNIVAWRTSVHGALEPVVLDEHFAFMEADHAVLFLDGKVEARDRPYDSIDHWMKEMKDPVDAATALAARKGSTIQ